MLNEILIKYFHYSFIQFGLYFLEYILFWLFKFILGCVAQNVFDDFQFELVAILHIWEFTYHALNSIEIQIGL